MKTGKIGVITDWEGRVAPLFPGYPWHLRVYKAGASGPVRVEAEHEPLRGDYDDYRFGWGYHGFGRGWGFGRFRGRGWWHGRGFGPGFGRGRGFGGGYGWGWGRGYGAWNCPWDYYSYRMADVDVLLVADAGPWFAEELRRLGVRVIRTEARDAESAAREYWSSLSGQAEQPRDGGAL